MYGLDGEASIAKRLMWRTLRKMGVDEVDIPEDFKNSIVQKSKKGPIGAIVVRRMTGVEKNSAAKTMRQFAFNVGGKEEVAEKLEAIREDLSKEQLVLLDLLGTPSKRSLTRLVADAQAEPTGVLRAYARGCIELGKVGAAIEAHRNLPAIPKELYKMALDREDVCKVCGGTGTCKGKVTDRMETIPCPNCGGEKTIIRESAHKEFAINKLLEITKLTEKGGATVNVNTAIGVKVNGGGGGDFFSRMLKTSDEILYSQRRGDVVDAELIDKKGGPGDGKRG